MFPLKMRPVSYSIVIIPLLVDENHIGYSRLIRNASLSYEPFASVILALTNSVYRTRKGKNLLPFRLVLSELEGANHAMNLILPEQAS
jgi:hypothetical protein